MINNKYDCKMHIRYAYYWCAQWLMVNFLHIRAVMWSQYADYSSSGVHHAYAVWKAYLSRGTYQYCEMYAYQCLWWHCWLHWVHVRYIYWHNCLICAHELIGICGISRAFEGYICYWYIYVYSIEVKVDI